MSCCRGWTVGQDSGTPWKGLEKEMDVPDRACFKSSHSVFWVSVLFGIRVSWVCQGPAELCSLTITHGCSSKRTTMKWGCPKKGSAGTWQIQWFQITEEHIDKITADKTLQKYP